MHKESCEKMGNGRALREEHNAHPRSSLWTASILELVEFILRPPKGGPPSFPEHTDSVWLSRALLGFFPDYIMIA